MPSILSNIPLINKLTASEWKGPQLSVVVRGGQLRLLMTEQRKIVWYRVIPLNPAYLEGGMVAQPRAVAASFKAALEQSPAPLIPEGVAAVGGYHALSSIIDVPNAREFKPEEIIPREARRLFAYRPDSSSLTWWPVKSDSAARRFLFVVTRRAAMQSLRELFAMAGIRLRGLDSGPLAVAAAANLEEGIVVQAEADGGDVIVLKGGTVGLVRSAFWGGDIVDQESLLSRVADLTDRAVASHNDAYGGSLASDGGDVLYTLRGGSNAFWAYSISGDNWAVLATTPATVNGGASLGYVSTGTGSVYALRGNNDTPFWRYDIFTSAWVATPPADAPGTVNFGGAIVWDGATDIYALRGNTTVDFWRYNLVTDFWSFMPDTPAAVVRGGSMVNVGGIYYALRGDATTDFWKF
jgi:hypothetical protein